MKHFQYLFRLLVALIAISTARAVYAQQDPLLNIDVIRPDRRFDKLVLFEFEDREDRRRP